MKFSKKRLHEIITQELSKEESDQPLYEGLSEQDIYSLYYDIRDGTLRFAEFKNYIQQLLNIVSVKDSGQMHDPVAFAQSREE